jgi:IS30 family transposase
MDFSVEFSLGNFLKERKIMTDSITKKNKHMTIDDRLEIQECLDKGLTFKQIGKIVGKDQTTISKEVKKHFVVSPSNIKRTDLNGNPKPAEVCPTLIKAPFVCNPCKRRHANCGYQKQFYRAKVAHGEYATMLSESREGIPLNKDEFYEIDRIITSGIKSGQRIYHIMQTNKIKVSKSTIYRHLNRGYLSVSRIDLPRAVKFKTRRPKRADYVPKAAKIGRTYDDFRSHIEETNITSWVEMDTVIGRIGGKVILTLDFTFCNFMVGLLLEDKTAAEMTEKLLRIKSDFIANELKFGDIFPLILTDNGGEFSNVSAIENSLDGVKETSLYFCDPLSSWQKPKVEKNHTMFRDIVPKGESFDDFTQETVSTIFSHVNSIKRKIFFGKTPYEMFSFTISREVATLFGIVPIPAGKVIQSPLLLKQLRRNGVSVSAKQEG